MPFSEAAVIVSEGLPWSGVTGNPAPGGGIRLELQGSPGEAGYCVLGLTTSTSPGGATTVTPDLLLGPLALDAAGVGRLPIAIPPSPSLSGLRLYYQAYTVGGVPAVEAGDNVTVIDIR